MKTPGKRPVDVWMAIEKKWRHDFPHVVSFFSDMETFVEIRLKQRDDGTVLAICKGYGDKGNPIVCFGVGYDVITALMAVDRTIAGGHWREDKPWRSGK